MSPLTPSLVSKTGSLVATRKQRALSFLPLSVSFFGLALTTFLLNKDIELHRIEQANQEDQALIQASQAIEFKLASTSQILFGVVGLIDSSKSLSRSGFATYYEALKLSGPAVAGIQGIGFTRALQPSQLSAYESSIRREGFPDFSVRPAGARTFYSSITYLEPFDWRNRRAFGFDMWSNPVRRQAMERAMKLGLPSLSGPVTLVQETVADVQVGTLLYLPVYRSKTTLFSAEDRRKALIGWAYAPLRMGDLIRAALDAPLVRFPKNADIQVFDGSTARSRLLFDSRDQERRSPSVIPGQQRKLNIYGRPWILRVSLPANRNVFDLKALIIAISGVLVSAGLGLVTYWLVRQHRSTLNSLEVLKTANEARQLSTAVISNLEEALMITDAQAQILQVNPAFTRITGYGESEAIGKPAGLLQGGVQGSEFFTKLWGDLNRYGSWQGEFWNRHRNGQLYRQSMSISSVRNEQGEITNFIGVFRDVTQEFNEQEQVRHQAQHDYLTGLPNRSLLVERLEQALRLAERQGRHVGLLFLDLNRFKPINDEYGHLAGDEILQVLGRRLRDAMRASDTVARFGGDEFVVLTPDVEHEEGILALAQKLRGIVDEPFQWNEHVLEIRASIGIALYPEHGTTQDALLAAADTAMYAAKQQGEGSIVVYNPASSSSRAPSS